MATRIVWICVRLERDGCATGSGESPPISLARTHMRSNSQCLKCAIPLVQGGFYPPRRDPDGRFFYAEKIRKRWRKGGLNSPSACSRQPLFPGTRRVGGATLQGGIRGCRYVRIYYMLRLLRKPTQHNRNRPTAGNAFG